MKHHKWLILFVSVSMIAPILIACSNVETKKPTENKAEINATNEFNNLLEWYQKQNKIVSNQDRFGKHWSYLWNKDKIPLFKQPYLIIETLDDLKEKILNKFDRKLFVELYNSKKYSLDFDIRKLDEKDILELNLQKFSNIFLNNQNLETFFKENNLLIAQYWLDPNDKNKYNQKYLIPDPTHQSDTHLIFDVVSPNDLYYVEDFWLYQSSPQYEKDFLYKDVKLTVITFNKGKKIFIDENLTKTQTKNIYKTLLTKYGDRV
ncbi:hypothetical protein ACR82Z_04355 [Mycoplasma sp. 6243]|uniref:hypothetical protein n=1 Tax=Mycoplasma sp. 6243 TaxID=3440865 RepID=UPI003EBDC37C